MNTALIFDHGMAFTGNFYRVCLRVLFHISFIAGDVGKQVYLSF
mgnify:CR=1 FL=1